MVIMCYSFNTVHVIECQHIVSSIKEYEIEGNYLNASIYCECPSEPQLETEQFQIQISNIPENSLMLLTMRLEDHCNKRCGTEFTLQPQKEGYALLIIKWNPAQKGKNHDCYKGINYYNQ